MSDTVPSVISKAGIEVVLMSLLLLGDGFSAEICRLLLASNCRRIFFYLSNYEASLDGQRFYPTVVLRHPGAVLDSTPLRRPRVSDRFRSSFSAAESPPTASPSGPSPLAAKRGGGPWCSGAARTKSVFRTSPEYPAVSFFPRKNSLLGARSIRPIPSVRPSPPPSSSLCSPCLTDTSYDTF